MSAATSGCADLKISPACRYAHEGYIDRVTVSGSPHLLAGLISAVSACAGDDIGRNGAEIEPWKTEPKRAQRKSPRRLGAQLEALDLAGGGFRQVASELDPAGIFVRCELLPAMLLQRAGSLVARGAGRFEHHEG